MNVNAVNVIYLVEPFKFYNIINRPCVNTPLQITNGKIKGWALFISNLNHPWIYSADFSFVYPAGLKIFIFWPNSFLLAGTMHQPEITGLSWRWRLHPLKTWKPDPCLVCFHRGVWAPCFLLCRAYRSLYPGCSDWSQAAGMKIFSFLCSLLFLAAPAALNLNI